MFKTLVQMKQVKFLLGGGVATALNLLLMFGFIEGLGLSTPVLRNTANAVAIELSLLASFFIYRKWVWPGGAWTLREVLGRQLPLYHMSAGSAVILRICVLFPLYDWLGVHYALNTLIGILAGASINYVISDRLIFKAPEPSARRQSAIAFDPSIHYPESLAPALEGNFVAPGAPAAQRSTALSLFSIVIPAYNEEDGIEATIRAIGQALDEKEIVYEILVVNDNSRDRTEACVQRSCRHNGKVRYVNSHYPRGFGFAVRCGLEHFRGDAVAIVMADSSDAPENIIDYYAKLREGYDCVFGSRFIRGGKAIDYPTHKLLVNRVANVFIQLLFGLAYNDVTNAFKAYRREVIEGISPLLSHHFNLTVEMPLKAIVRGYSYAVVPITWQNRTTGVSKLKLQEMGSRYLFVVLYAWLEKHLSRGDYVPDKSALERPAEALIETVPARGETPEC